MDRCEPIKSCSLATVGRALHPLPCRSQLLADAVPMRCHRSDGPRSPRTGQSSSSLCALAAPWLTLSRQPQLVRADQFEQTRRKEKEHGRAQRGITLPLPFPFPASCFYKLTRSVCVRNHQPRCDLCCTGGGGTKRLAAGGSVSGWLATNQIQRRERERKSPPGTQKQNRQPAGHVQPG